MKFVEAIKALGPGQLFTNQHGGKYEVKDGSLFHADSFKLVSELGYIYACDWQVIDKPRPRVKFDAAIAAALDGKVIRSHSGDSYKFFDGSLKDICGVFISISHTEFAGDWEIIEPEGDK